MKNEQTVALVIEKTRALLTLAQAMSIALRGKLSAGDYDRFARATLALRNAVKEMDKPEPVVIVTEETMANEQAKPHRRTRKAGQIETSLDEVMR